MEKSTGLGSDLAAALGFPSEPGPVTSPPHVLISLFRQVSCLRNQLLRPEAALPYS